MNLTLQPSNIFLANNRIHWLIKSVVALINCVLNQRIIGMSLGSDRSTPSKIEPLNTLSTRVNKTQDRNKIFNLQPALHAVNTTSSPISYSQYLVNFGSNLLVYAAASIVFTQNESNSNKHQRWSKPHRYGGERRISPTLRRI